ncbi:hypothetical protein TPHA_0G02260 [Tetrapisispora phaffii CBS 4417]|uniref:AB hydrolase-1 domain-containing protein n=1 Tax=Tetrapisispora phaffii (strain ATCC 24235 / CBS 4417 / NBRC 1672 / NRRL Y-8282 / UCD 70-5) TaxID=1071381 RepID=G8BVY4_TETPH|nr:hypothetical protein TPHA_0G02260 [Tetrapisispora phaffii CBS 4417]CCE64062.1 hypothetical protein TPHA_0G02260 [Tetrapisispora phaffii CBS 4417]
MILPFLSRLNLTDYFIIILVYIEFVTSSILQFIPTKLINSITWLFQHLFTSNPAMDIPVNEVPIDTQLRLAPSIHEMCKLFNVEVEDYLVRTEDDYILTIHRIPPRKDLHDTEVTPKVAYLHHGLLMCSDIWCCNVERHKNLPFVLHDLGYDVWMGNNRGNKYSTAHVFLQPGSPKFWNFSIDEFAYFDIPNTINYILENVNAEQVTCIGFSQGSAQMFAALSINKKLNEKISQFIAIAPAMTPHGLHNRIVDKIVKATPKLMYLFFGRNIVLPSATVWRRTLHPKLFNTLIDVANIMLFNWNSKNITIKQKFISYSKLYSTTSVKCIVHWFQILRSQKFQLYEEPDDMFNSLSRPYLIPVFPTRTNIKVPILLIYGGSDSLVDIDVMKANLPPKRVFDIKIDNHEHLDLIWGNDVDVLVIDKVLKFIEFFTPIDDPSYRLLSKYFNSNNFKKYASITSEHTIKPENLIGTPRKNSVAVASIHKRSPSIVSRHNYNERDSELKSYVTNESRNGDLVDLPEINSTSSCSSASEEEELHAEAVEIHRQLSQNHIPAQNNSDLELTKSVMDSIK